MDIFGNKAGNQFDQNLNTTDDVDFARVDVTDAITDNQQLATKLYVDTHGGGGGNMNYTGTTPATNYIYKASASNGQDAIKSSITDDGTNCIVSATNGITANKIIKSGGTAIQYLMGDGSVLTQSANSGNSNFYLYQSKNGITTPPPLAGDVGYNNAVQSLATLVYISHLTRDNIDIEVFYNQVNELNDLYIQDQNNSLNFIKYNIIGPLIPTPNSYVEIPVVMSSYGGTGNTSFGSNHNVLVAFFSNNLEIDQRLTTLETKTENQTAIPNTTTFTGPLIVKNGVPALPIINWISVGNSAITASIGLQIITLKTIVVSAVGCKANVLLTPPVYRNFYIYNGAGSAVGGPYFINRLNLDETGAYVKLSIPPLTLPAGTYHFAISLDFDDYFNGDDVSTSYTNTDPSVILSFTGCIGSIPDAFPGTLDNNRSHTVFWFETFESVKVGSVILAGSSYSIDTLEALPLNLGTTNATTINIGRTGSTTKLNSLFAPSGVGNIDIMLRDSPFIGLQFINGNASLTALSNSLWTAAGFTSNNFPTYALTNNFTRQLCCGNWTTTGLSDGQACGYVSTVTTGARVSTGFNFGLSAILGISDSAYNANNCQNFFGLWNASTTIPLAQAALSQLSVLRNMICFGSDTNDPNICIYTAGAASTVKQVDLGASFPANRPIGALSTDFFKFTLYWDTSKFYYKAVNTTTHVIVSGTFTALVADMPSTVTNLYPQCVRVMGTPQSNGQAKLQVQRFGLYY